MSRESNSIANAAAEATELLDACSDSLMMWHGMKRAVRQPTTRLQRWRRRLRRLFLVLLLAALAGGYYAYRNLPDVISARAQRQAPQFSLSIEHATLVSLNRIEFRNVSLRFRETNAEALRLTRATIDFSLGGLRRRHLDAVTIDDPVVFVNEAMLKQWFASAHAGPGDEAETPWTLGTWAVRGGIAHLDIASQPRVQFKFSSEPQRLGLTDIVISGRDPQIPSRAEIKSIDLRFTVAEIARGHLREVIVRNPSLQLTPEVLMWLRGPSEVGTPSSGAAEVRFRVDRLLVDHGEMQVSGFGRNLPDASFNFGLETTNLGLGERAEKLHHVQLWEIALWPASARVKQFLTIDSAQVDVTPAGLLTRNELAGVIVTGGVFRAGQEFRSLVADAQSESSAAASASPERNKPWMIRHLDIHNGRVALADLGVEIPEVQFDLNTRLNDVPLSSDIAFASEEMQRLEFADLSLHSPLDPFVTVVNLKTVFVNFSFAQIMRHEIDALTILNPTIYISPDLFWYVDHLKGRETETPPPSPSSAQVAPTDAGWRLKRFDAAYGQLVIANQGQPHIPLPLSFSTHSDNVRFNNVSDLQLKLSLLVPKADYSFPSYELAFQQLGGEIKFGLPPEKDANNLVQTLRSEAVQWRQFTGTQVFWSVTYDEKGIYGSFGGAAYDGYINGAFSFFLKPDSPWQGWISGSKVDLAQLTDLMAPQNFHMTGPVDFTMTVKAHSREIEQVAGEFKTRKPGQLKIGKLDDLMSNIPAEWTNLKQSATRIGLETLRDFDYESGHGDVAFAGKTGKFTLRLQGPNGSRNFDILFH